MAPPDERVTPRPVLVTFDPSRARDILSEVVPWEFRRTRSGHETGAQVLVCVSGAEPAVTGTYTAGTVFEYRSLATLKEGVHRSEMARFGKDEINEEWLEEVFGRLPRGWAVDICEPRRFAPHLALGHAAAGKKLSGPQGFQLLDLEDPDHARLWSQAGRS